jgi:kynurenine formamidase
MTRLVDCSHEVVDGMTTYPGLPGPTITTHLSREDTAQRMAPGISFQIGRIDMVANTGTYIDSPWHFHADGPDLAGLALTRIADLPAVVVHLDGHDGGIDVGALPAGEYEGHAVLFHTGWDRNWRTDRYGESAPYLTSAVVESLLASRAALVGIDSVNIDSITDLTRPAHHGLLGAGVPIVEHLTHLDQLPERGARFFAVPPKVSGFGTFPVRAFAMIAE